MFKESFYVETPESKQKLEEKFFEDKIEKIKDFKSQEESKVFSQAETKINQEKDPEKKTEKITKLATYVLTSLLAFGTVQEGLLRESLAQATPEKETQLVLEKINIEELEGQRLENYQKLKKIIEEEKIEEKIEFLKKEYGPAIENFFYFSFIPDTLKFLKELEVGIEKNDPNILVDKNFPFAMTYGSLISRYLEEKWTVLSKEQKLEKSKDIIVKGFENLSEIGISNEDIKNILKEKYPSQWLQCSISYIRYIPKTEGLLESFFSGFKGGEAQAFGLPRFPFPVREMGSIDIFKHPGWIFRQPSKEKALAYILKVIHHELAHTNDWDGSQILSNQERINLLYEVSQRYKSPDRFKSRYVESIKNKDKFMESYIKTNEYWAEIVKVYMQDKNKFEKNWPEDAQLVEKWYNRINDIEK